MLISHIIFAFAIMKILVVFLFILTLVYTSPQGGIININANDVGNVAADDVVDADTLGGSRNPTNSTNGVRPATGT